MIKNLSINFSYDRERKIPFRFEKHTLQFTLKIALNIEMQSNLFKLLEKRKTWDKTRQYLYMITWKGRGWSTENLIYYSTSVKDNITNNTARLILGEKVETFGDHKVIFSYQCLKNREVYRPEILFEENFCSY